MVYKSASLAIMNPSEILSVSQLNQRARHLLEDVFPAVVVEGEISNLARPASGHLYFTLKDSNAQIRCAFFRQNTLRSRQKAADGLQVRVTGRLSIYEGRGDYQLIISQLEAAGEGALRAAFEALKQQLLQEGLFAAERKQPLPRFPRRVGLITSPTGAVIRDIISVFARRAPHIELVLLPTQVQGKEAVAQILNALRLADSAGFDAIILARGGGSLEDLWCFNEEVIARCLADCKTPIVSAIGHETDTSISDFVADLRAPTPTAAAELLSPDRKQLLHNLSAIEQRLALRLRTQLHSCQLQLDALSKRMRHPRERIEQNMQRLDDLQLRLNRAISQHLQHTDWQLQQGIRVLDGQSIRQRLRTEQLSLMQLNRRLQLGLQTQLQQQSLRFKQLVRSLQLVSPLATLERGYAIVTDSQHKVVHSVQPVTSGQTLNVRLADGNLQTQVLSIHHSQKSSR